MITGTVNGRLEIVIRLPVRDSAGQDHEVEAILDTLPGDDGTADGELS
jgi:hypothetical protein